MDFEESSPTPQFKSTNSLVLSFLYGPTLTSIYDNWKNHSFDHMELGRQGVKAIFFGNKITGFPHSNFK